MGNNSSMLYTKGRATHSVECSILTGRATRSVEDAWKDKYPMGFDMRLQG